MKSLETGRVGPRGGDPIVGLGVSSPVVSATGSRRWWARRSPGRWWAAARLGLMGLGLAALAGLRGQAAVLGEFVIEAEDFNFGGGNAQASANVMPYYGGAYQGLAAVHEVDYHRTADEPSGNEYRLGESPNVPMVATPDMRRRFWDVTTSYRLGWQGNGNWCNYTRTFPTGYYRIYAALSYDGRAPGQLHGNLHRVTSGATNTQQTLALLGTFDGPGSGGWGVNSLVPLQDASGKALILPLSGKQTVRFTSTSGDFDYLDFIRAAPPQVAQSPTNVTVVENRPATFTVITATDDPATFQWQSNRVNIVGATSSNYTFRPALSASGARYRCALTNVLGQTNSAEALLTVTPDSERPRLVQAMNLGATTVRLTFDEGVALPAGAASASFALDGGASVSAAAAGATNAEVLLTVSALTWGATYTVTVSQVTDLAQTPNAILPGSTISFVACEYTPTDVGGPALAGTATRVGAGAFDVTAGGSDIGGASDQFALAWEQRVGDFDCQVRVANVTLSDLFMHAGLMLRESLAPNARFAAVFASSAALGCFFESRDPAGAAAATATLPGGFPVNYPQTWLRLRRISSTVTGFGSVDGVTWVQLGSRTLSNLARTLYFGLAVASDDPARTATVQFRDLGPTTSLTAGAYTATAEPPAPSSRTTGLILSEIMYHPPRRADGGNLEFIELYNAGVLFEDLTGWRLGGDIEYQFPDGFVLPAGAFVVVAAVPVHLRAVHGLTNVLGPYAHSLPNEGGSIRLFNPYGALRLRVDYSPDPPWPVAADGAGHSLVLARASYGENDPRAWSPSELIGGSPGGLDTVYPNPQRSVVINEWLVNPSGAQAGFLELYNHANAEVDLSGCRLAIPPATNPCVLPAGTAIAARGFLALRPDQHGLPLNPAGDTVWLLNSNATRILDAVRFGGQEQGVSSGRCPDGGPAIRRLASATPGQPNDRWRPESVVINEIMYRPISGDDDDEYLELYNRAAEAVDLSGWRLVAGVDFQFPADSVLPPGAYLVVAKNAARLRANYPQLPAEGVYGDYRGTLRASGERIALAKPIAVTRTNDAGEVTSTVGWAAVAETAYGTGGRWGRWAAGGGSSLELIDPNADPACAANWADSDETQKAEWTSVAATGILDNGLDGYLPERVYLLMQGGGECLVDDLEVLRVGGTNLVANGGFEDGATGWSFFGNHSESSVDPAGAFSGSRCLHVRGQEDGDTGVNSIRANLAPGLARGGQGTIRAKVRWLKGWPELLFRTRGNWFELVARMNVPRNLGTPGLPNSRRVGNAGPAIYEVTHRPALPRANRPVVVTCRVSDPDGLSALNLRFRLDPATNLTTLAMRDDGLGGDEVAGDGVYSVNLSGRAAGTLMAYRLEAVDAATPGARTVFPANAPAQECLIRWEDPVPVGTFPHYHLWSTAATENTRGSSTALNNTFRDATLVYGNSRVLYNVGFRDKGSPWHGGAGDWALQCPDDDLLLGVSERVFGSTGNGGSEDTNLRGQLAAWLAQQLSIPYVHAQYIELYRNGGQFRDVMEDVEQPNRQYARNWAPAPGEGELFKIAIWYDFQDDNTTFGAVGATLQSFTTTGGAYDLSRYRWTWRIRPSFGSANNYSNLFGLVTVANDSTTNYVSRLLNLADVDEWMRVFVFNRILGNWDSYGIGSQNMYAYQQPNQRWLLIPWDIDIILGIGGPPNDALWGGGDPVLNRMFDTPTFRRMVWRAYQDAVSGPMLEPNYGPQIEARRALLLKNGVTGISDARTVYNYLNDRRSHILSQLQANDVQAFVLTSNGGTNYVSRTTTTLLEGRAPFAVASIEVNGLPYPILWTDQNRFRMAVPLPQATNTLSLVGRDRLGRPVPGATTSVIVTYTGAIPRVEDYVVLNEIHYHPVEPGASFIELYNRSTTTPFDLSAFRLDGVRYTFPDGAMIQPNNYLVLVANRAAFANAYGAALAVFGEFPGSLDHGGEHLALVRPGLSLAGDVLVSDVRYDHRLPWPTNAAGLGPSLQLVDPTQGAYRVANWAATATNDASRVTPGRANSPRQSLAQFEALWINEVLPRNLSGLPDAAGEREPWLELYNGGANRIDLSPYYLTDTYTNLTQWQFPAGASIGSNSFLLIWADGQLSQSTPASPHTNFRLHPTNGSVALVRLQGWPWTPAVIDYLDYVAPDPDCSLGSYPDGEPRRRRPLYFPTPGATNDPACPPVRVLINEFMAGNTVTLRDPADGHFEDWFELYNAGTNTVNLMGYGLTDDYLHPGQFTIPPGYLIRPGEFLLVWADEDTGQNSPTNADLHISFKLSLGGDQIGLFAPDGRWVDGFSFGPQTNDVSVGRFPDGGEPPLVAMESPSPRGPNRLIGANQPPVLDPIPDASAAEGTLLSFVAIATDADPGQTLTFSLSPDAPAGTAIDPRTGRFSWTPAEPQGPGVYSLVVRVTDDGTPPRASARRFAVTVTEVNRPPVLNPVPDRDVHEGERLAFGLEAADPDVPANALAFSLETGAPAGAAVDPATGVFSWIPTEAQGPGTYVIGVRVMDDGVPSMSASTTFRVIVQETASPPVMDPVLPQTVLEGDTLRLVVHAEDLDSPPSPLRYSLDWAPAGAQIDASSGTIVWRPTEAQGPTNAIFIVRATKIAAPTLSDAITFSVTVTEQNEPPTLHPIGNVTLLEGDTLTFTVSATDPDLPAQSLAFSLGPGAPPGASLDPVSGRFRWTTRGDQGASTNHFTVRVTDAGSPPLTDTRTFTVTVLPRWHVVINEIMYRPAVTGAGYVELLNASSNTTADLSGVALAGAHFTWTFPAGTVLPPGDGVCVVENPAAFAAVYGGELPVVGPWSGSLAAPDTVRLFRPNAHGEVLELLDAVVFDQAPPWPAANPGASLQLVDATRDNDRVGNWSATTAYTGPRQLIVMTNQWLYRQTDAPPIPAWRGTNYDDSAWPRGAALLYAETADLPAPKNTPLTLGRMTYYFRTRFTVPTVPLNATLSLFTVVDDAVAVWLNGQPLLSLGLPEGDPADITPSARTVGDAVLEGPFPRPTDYLVPGENVMAAEVHQWDPGSSDVVFGLSLELEGGEVLAGTPGRPNSVATSLSAFPALRINEVLPRNTAGLVDAAGEHDPWIELINTSDEPVGLDGLYLTDDFANLTQWAFPPGFAVPAGGFLVLFADGEPGESTVTELHASFRLPQAPEARWNLALTRLQAGRPAVVDYLAGWVAGDDISLGRLPDGGASPGIVLSRASPGSPNQPLTALLRLGEVRFSPDGDPVLTWSADVGRAYRIEYKTTLDQPVWQTLDELRAISDTVVWTDTNLGLAPQRYYRLRALD